MLVNVKSKAYFALFLTSIIWGTTWVVSKIGFAGMHPIFFAALRQLIAGTLFLLFFVLNKKAVWPKPKEWAYLVLMGILLFSISNALTIWGIRYINSGLGAIIGALFPIFVTLINWLIGSKNNPNIIATTGLVLGLLGLVVIFYEHLTDFSNAGFGFGIFLSVSSCVSWAIGTIITTRNLVSLNRYYALGWQMFIGGLILNIVCYSTGLTIPISDISITTWVCILYMVIFASIIAFVSFLYTLQHLPTPVASIYAYVNPVVAVLLGHFVLKESWSISLLAGAVVTLLGVYFVNKGFKKIEAPVEGSEI